jgi:hypothetical protein
MFLETRDGLRREATKSASRQLRDARIWHVGRELLGVGVISLFCECMKITRNTCDNLGGNSNKTVFRWFKLGALLFVLQASVWDVDGTGMQKVDDPVVDMRIRKVRERNRKSTFCFGSDCPFFV